MIVLLLLKCVEPISVRFLVGDNDDDDDVMMFDDDMSMKKMMMN